MNNSDQFGKLGRKNLKMLCREIARKMEEIDQHTRKRRKAEAAAG